MSVLPRLPFRLSAAAALAAGLLGASAAGAADFSVTPIKAELGAGALSETITVTNHAATRLRVGVRLYEWTQDEQGQDVYKDSSDLVYFPRQMDFEPGAKKVVRIGMKSPAGPVERSYRLFIEEMPDPLDTSAQAAVAFTFRFGVAVFAGPAAPARDFQVLEPRLERGKVILPVRNAGNKHVRLTRVSLTDGSHRQEIAGWYSLPNTSREYRLDLPADVCRRGPTLTITAEAPELKVDRQLHVDPGSCS